MNGLPGTVTSRAVYMKNRKAMTEEKGERVYVNRLGRKLQMVRMMWALAWTVGARWLPRSVGSGWKRWLLRLFGAKIAKTAVVYSSARVYYPANLVMDEYACLASDVDCYNVDMVYVGRHATVSQYAFLCTASHDIYSTGHELITAPIRIEAGAWIGAGAFVGMGVTVEEGAVVGARGVVVKDVEAWTVVGGNPAKFIKKRIIKNEK